MTVIAVANQKGGVGKTTSTLNVGAALQEAGKRVLLIDLDPQGNLSVTAGLHDVDSAYPSIGDLLSQAARGRAGGSVPVDLSPAIVRTPAGLDLVPGNATLSAAELSLVSALNREAVLAGLIERVAPHYDYILIDCLPSLGLLAINALRAADGVIIPVQADFLATQGLGQIVETIAAVREQLNPGLSILGVLLTLVDQRTAHAREVTSVVRTSLAGKVRVFDTEIRLHVALKEAATTGRSILEYAPKSPSAEAYRAVALEVRRALGDAIGTSVASRTGAGSVLAFSTFLAERSEWLGADHALPECAKSIDDARAAARSGDFEQATILAERALERYPSSLLALRALAWSRLQLGHAAVADTFGRCAELDPEDALAHVGQALHAEQQDDVESATRHWVTAWELDPHNQTIRRALVKLTGELPESDLADGISLLRARQFDEAAELVQSCAAERRDAASALAMVDALWGMGEPLRALDLALGVHAAYPASIKAALYVAVVEERAGRTLHCRELMARAEQADPGLVVFGDLVRQLGLLQAAADQPRPSRVLLAVAR